MRKAIPVLLSLGMLSLTCFAESGADIFKGRCAMCHGADGTPSAPMIKSLGVKNLTSDEVQKQSDAELKTAVEKGKGKMTGFAGKLTPAQIDDVIKYVRGLKK